MLKPFFGPVEPGQTERPVWNAGVAPTVGTGQIAMGATYEIYSYEQAAPVTLNLNFPAITPAAVTVGPYAMDTKAIITAQCVVTYGSLSSGAPRKGPVFAINGTLDGTPLSSLKATDLVFAYAPDVAQNSTAYSYRPALRMVVDLRAGQVLSDVYLRMQNARVGPDFIDPGVTTAVGGLLTLEVTKLR